MFKLSIETGNAAFAYNPADHVARILIEVARKLDAGRDRGMISDANGNVVGSFQLDSES